MATTTITKDEAAARRLSIKNQTRDEREERRERSTHNAAERAKELAKLRDNLRGCADALVTQATARYMEGTVPASARTGSLKSYQIHPDEMGAYSNYSPRQQRQIKREMRRILRKEYFSRWAWYRLRMFVCWDGYSFNDVGLKLIVLHLPS